MGQIWLEQTENSINGAFSCCSSYHSNLQLNYTNKSVFSAMIKFLLDWSIKFPILKLHLGII